MEDKQYEKHEKVTFLAEPNVVLDGPKKKPPGRVAQNLKFRRPIRTLDLFDVAGFLENP